MSVTTFHSLFIIFLLIGFVLFSISIYLSIRFQFFTTLKDLRHKNIKKAIYNTKQMTQVPKEKSNYAPITKEQINKRNPVLNVSENIKFEHIEDTTYMDFKNASRFIEEHTTLQDATSIMEDKTTLLEDKVVHNLGLTYIVEKQNEETVETTFIEENETGTTFMEEDTTLIDKK